jgi:hypothetical protein
MTVTSLNYPSDVYGLERIIGINEDQKKYKKYYELDLGRNYDTCDVHLKWIGHGMYFELEKTDLIHIVEELLKVNLFGKPYNVSTFAKEIQKFCVMFNEEGLGLRLSEYLIKSIKTLADRKKVQCEYNHFSRTNPTVPFSKWYNEVYNAPINLDELDDRQFYAG